MLVLITLATPRKLLTVLHKKPPYDCFVLCRFLCTTRFSVVCMDDNNCQMVVKLDKLQRRLETESAGSPSDIQQTLATTRQSVRDINLSLVIKDASQHLGLCD